jgi:hypothetical protein
MQSAVIFHYKPCSNFPWSRFSNRSKFFAAGSAAIDQVPRQEPGAQPQRPDGGRREAVAVSARDV